VFDASRAALCARRIDAIKQQRTTAKRVQCQEVLGV